MMKYDLKTLNHIGDQQYDGHPKIYGTCKLDQK